MQLYGMGYTSTSLLTNANSTARQRRRATKKHVRRTSVPAGGIASSSLSPSCRHALQRYGTRYKDPSDAIKRR